MTTALRQGMRLALCAIVAFTASSPCWGEESSSERPNIVFIVADDLGYGDLACYGSERHRTPHIDALAEGGVRFTQFRVNPLCAPTRASLMTGLYSLETGMWRGPAGGAGQAEDEGTAGPPRKRARRASASGAPRRGSDDATRDRALHADLRLLPHFLQEAGYATGMFGKWHLGEEARNLPNERGFAEFVGFLGGAHPYEPGRGAPILKNGERLDDDRHLTDLFTDEAIKFIEAKRAEPFFCYLAYNAVHGPLWTSDRPNNSGKPEWLEKAAARGLDFPERDYAAVLEHLDASVGRVVEALQDAGLDERTLVLFISDNGAIIDKFSGDNGPLRGQKAETYEGGIRVPAIANWPGVIPAGVSDAQAVAEDCFATILDAAKIDVPATNGRHAVHGVSLLPHLQSSLQEPLPDRYLFWDLFGRLAAFHDGWKLVGSIDNHRGQFEQALPKIEEAEFELYYLPDDIGEQRNLADAHPEITADLKQRLVHWFRDSTR